MFVSVHHVVRVLNGFLDMAGISVIIGIPIGNIRNAGVFLPQGFHGGQKLPVQFLQLLKMAVQDHAEFIAADTVTGAVFSVYGP